MMGQRGVSNRDADQAMIVDNKWPHELLMLPVAMIWSKQTAVRCARLRSTSNYAIALTLAVLLVKAREHFP